MAKIIITASNEEYDSDGVCIGSYDEIHEIEGLSSIDHLIDTIISIINLNTRYCDCKLKNIEVSIPLLSPFKVDDIYVGLRVRNDKDVNVIVERRSILNE